MVDAKAIGEWMKAPNPAFDGSTPCRGKRTYLADDLEQEQRKILLQRVKTR